jgi:3-hydroxyacyl-CoA dehydrogenase/enoyl-CoA hydratase/3-hydroxybutyryl-CoA epimerase/enoyl-CoA isomerase
MHFFHPAHRMKLVEVIRGEQTSDDTVATLVALAGKLGKTAIVVHDCPGFLVTRVLFPYLSQAIQLLREGVAMDAIDEAAVGFGMPMGPIALLDFIGLDTALAIANVMAEGYPDRAAPSPLLAEMVGSGRLGRKSGAGFRSHDSARSRPESDQAVASILERHRLARDSVGKDDLVDRLFLPMLLESARVLEEGIVGGPSDVDLGVVLGFGFPSARGGILHWCDAEGADSILERSKRLEDLGPWYQPSDRLRRMALRKESFHTPQPPAALARESRQPAS